jgi:vitamin B12 transporter
MKFLFMTVFSVFTITSPAILLADEVDREVVVTATRVSTASEDVPNPVTVITAEEIEESGARTVAEVLESVPGLEFNALGGIGQQQSLFVRGSDPAHVLVLVDGIEINDPGSPKRTFNWAHLAVDSIERIEVVRGPAGPLYGSDAMAGVVNIITRSGEGKSSVMVEAESGSYTTSFGRLGLSGALGGGGYSLAVSSFTSDGISAAEKEDGNSEEDGYSNLAITGRLDLPLGKKNSLELIFRSTDSTTDLDEINGNTFLFGDDPNSTIDESSSTLGAWLNLGTAGGSLEQRVGASVTDYHRDYRNPPDGINPNDDSEVDDGTNLHLAWQGTLDLGNGGLLTVGADYDRDTVESEADFTGFPITVDKREASNIGVFIQEQLEMADSVLVTVGFRTDNHDGFDNQLTWRVGFTSGSIDDGLLVRGNAATGYKAPTIYQLYNSSSGNPDLEPETSTGWDLGAEVPVGSGSLGVSCFANSFEELIDFSGFTYFNVDKAKTRGAELFAVVKPAESLRLRAAYTALETEDVEAGEDLIRRPENKFSLMANYSPGEKITLNLTGIMVGKRLDRDFSTWPASLVKLDDYALVNLAGSVKLIEGVELTGRVENLLDEDYQEAFGYGTPGVSVYMGVKASF